MLGSDMAACSKSLAASTAAITLPTSPAERLARGVGEGAGVLEGGGAGVAVGGGVGVGGTGVAVGNAGVAVGGRGDGEGDGAGGGVEVGVSSRDGGAGVSVAVGWRMADDRGAGEAVGITGGVVAVAVTWMLADDELPMAGSTTPLSTAVRPPQTINQNITPSSNAPMRPGAPFRPGLSTIGPIFCLPRSAASTRDGPMRRMVRGSMITTRYKRRESSFMISV